VTRVELAAEGQNFSSSTTFRWKLSGEIDLLAVAWNLHDDLDGNIGNITKLIEANIRFSVVRLWAMTSIEHSSAPNLTH
jgi:hypothetical protein